MRIGRALLALAAFGSGASAAAPDFGPPGASSCSGCHSRLEPAGSAVPEIYGRPEAEIVAALAAYRSGERPATVMNRIAPGFTEAESRAIATWLAAQRPVR